MITIKNKQAIRKMEEAGRRLSSIFPVLEGAIKPGISTLELDALIVAELAKRGLKSKTKGYCGYRHSSCISVNDEVVHGVPAESCKIADGDLVKIDICASWEGYAADMARCFFVGAVPEAARELVRVAQASLDKGIEQAIPGNRISDISAAVQREVERHGFGVVRDFAGHGIGKQMHEEPEILNFGAAGQGPVIRAGMTFAIEPMITQGGYKVYVTQDGWTVKTTDASLAAHVEDTVLVTENGPKILTRQSVQG